MLSPGDRTLIYDAVQPPSGYELDHALLSTYSLDLIALLAIPVSLTFRDWRERDDGSAAIDPIGLLESLRETAGRLTVACQAGEIAAPPLQRNLFVFLEDAVVGVSAPNGGVFHPKVHILRYVSDGGPVRYRLLCASRNLTHDRSWDVMLALDGKVRGGERRVRAGAGAADFVAGVRRLAGEARADSGRIGKLGEIEHELRRTEFQPPEGFDELRFHPIGFGDSGGDPFAGRRDRMLVISPFVGERRLSALSTGGMDTLIGSQAELDALPSDPAVDGREVFVLDPATGEPLDPESAEVADPAAAMDGGHQRLADSTDGLLHGLHAKVYVADCGWDARVWVGSANATTAAFERNVEMLVELHGKRRTCGIAAALGSEDSGLRNLLQPYRRDEDALTDPDREEAERLVDRSAHALGAAGVTLRVAASEPEGTFGLEVVLPAAGMRAVAGVEARAWPITLNVDRSGNLANKRSCRWSALKPEQITAFLAVELTAKGACELSRRVSIRCHLEGAPADRSGAVIGSILDSPEKLLRYLAFLLTDFDADPAGAMEMFDQLSEEPGSPEPGEPERRLPELPLLESLVRALARDPEKIDRVARLLADLRRVEGAESLLPEGFERVWSPIIEARGKLGS